MVRINKRVMAALNAANVDQGTAVKMSEKELLSIKGLGPKAVEAIMATKPTVVLGLSEEAAIIIQEQRETNSKMFVISELKRELEGEVEGIFEEIKDIEVPEEFNVEGERVQYYRDYVSNTLEEEKNLKLGIKKLLFAALPLVPTNLPLVQTVAWQSSLGVAPEEWVAEKDADLYKMGDVVTVPPKFKALVGAEIVRRLQMIGYLQIIVSKSLSTKYAKMYHIKMNWSKEVNLLLAKYSKAERLNNSVVVPTPFTKKRVRAGAFTKECSTPIRNKSSLFNSRATREGINDAQSVRLELTPLLTQEDVTEYIKVASKQRAEAQLILDNRVLRARLEKDEYIAYLKVSRFDTNELIKYLSEQFDENGNPIPFYVRKGLDNTSRVYDKGRGYQQDGFLRAIHTFSKSVPLDKPEDIAEMHKYREHILHQLRTCGKSMKDSIKALGYSLKLRQINAALKSKRSNVIVEYDAKNGGVQIYSMYLANPDILKYCGYNPESNLDVYKDAVEKTLDTLGLKGKIEVTREEGKKPVMVWIYGAGLETITLDGGAGWEGLYTILVERGTKEDMKGITPETVFEAFEDALEEMLPGVKDAMLKINSAHGRAQVIKTKSGETFVAKPTEYVFHNFLGSEAMLRPEQSEAFKIKMNWVVKGVVTYHTLEQYAYVSTPKAKSKGLAPLSVQSNDGGIVLRLSSVFARNDKPIVTVHDAFGVQITDAKFLKYSYKRVCVKLLKADQGNALLQELHEGHDYVPEIRRGDVEKCRDMIMDDRSQPLSF